MQLGQCGNQMGYELLQRLACECGAGVPAGEPTPPADVLLPQFFRRSYAKDGREAAMSRSVLVDMEPKVIWKVTGKAKLGGLWRYDPKAQFSRAGGCGNNWAYGCVFPSPPLPSPPLPSHA